MQEIAGTAGLVRDDRMHDILKAVILGIVEGLTEFLPISSTGHLILVEPWLGIPEGDPFWAGTFDIFIQIGAILAVVVYFWRRLWRLAVHPADRSWKENILVKLFVAFLPAAVVGLLLHDFMEKHLMTPFVVACALVVGGVAIMIIEAIVRHPRIGDVAGVSLRCALVIGLVQCLSMVPGTSRSGATIMGALLMGLTPAAAAEFSFFLSIPTIFAAGGFKLLKNIKEIEPQQFVTLGVGFVVSFVVAWFVVKVFMRFIQTHRFTSFAVYRIVLGVIVLSYYAHLFGGG
ncbi:MAG TPA: undecaprenyl-diphosphate phosphatase [Phycisphaerae bacterium]|nr:undecaprenyl-diphosphate phosphatase [Phycisphaerae bacterium]